MENLDSATAVFKCDAGKLLKLMSLDETAPDSWRAEEMPTMLRHQLSALIERDLGSADAGGAELERLTGAATEAAVAGIKTFEELFHHRQPPLGLLKRTKDLFKAMAGRAQKDSLEYRLAYVLYLLSISVARIRLGEKITNLTDGELVGCIDWAEKQAWLDGGTRELLAATRRRLQNPGPENS